ncbi:MAG: hypothetical protein ACI9WU_000371 [Myxococcota bacterium]|jgi:hypothetical protein
MMQRDVWVGVATLFSATCLLACAGEATQDGVPIQAFEEPVQATPDPVANIGYPPFHPKSESNPGPTTPPEDGKIASEPVIISLTPAEGVAEGGQVVTIEGDDFQDGLEVWFDDQPGVDVFFITDRFVNVTTPPSDPGAATLKIVNPDGGEGQLEAAFLFTAELEVHAVVPPVGSPVGGESVTVTGTGFELGVVVLFGDRLSPAVEVTSGGSLIALTPPGIVGSADVRVLFEGEDVALLADGFTYAAAPDLSGVWPLYGPTLGGIEVEVRGQYLTPQTRVWFGAKEAQVLSVSDDGTTAAVIAPGGPAGPADVTAEHAWGTGSLPGGFTRVAGPTVQLTVWNLVPARGSASGGTPVAIVAQGFDPAMTVSVFFDGQPATVTSTTDYPGVIFVDTPVGTPGLVDIEVAQGLQSVVVESGFEYLTPLALAEVTPGQLDPEGGSTVTLSGEGFSEGEVQVFVGGVASDSVTVTGDKTITIIAPPCSPGSLTVTIVVDGQTVALDEAVDCIPAEPHIYAVDPSAVSRAGGALVRVIGSGLAAGTTVRFGGAAGMEVDVQSSQALMTRVPSADDGAVDVDLSIPGAGVATLENGLLYMDPANKKAAIWGPLIDRTVNVSVFDSSTGKALPGAVAVLGADPATLRTCDTDARGQCTLSWPQLRGPLDITVARKDYSAYTIAGIEGSNITVYIRPQDPAGQQGPPGPPAGDGSPNVNINSLTGEIHGKLHGLGKYVLPPPPSCPIAGSPDGVQCTPCSAAQACPGDLVCQPINDTGSWCLKPCESDATCTAGFGCGILGSEPLCIPSGGELSATCGTSRRNFFGSNPNPGPGQTVDEDGTFEITSRLGEVTVYCIAGYTQPNSGLFVPTWLGIQPTVIVALDQLILDVDVFLTIPLSQTLRMSVFDLPESPGGVSDMYRIHAVDIGAEGWIPLNAIPTWTEGSGDAKTVFFAGYPESATVFHEDAAFTFYDSLSAIGMGGTAQSYRLAYRLPSVVSEPIRGRSAFEEDGEPAADSDPWTTIETGMGGDLNGIWGASTDNVWGVGPSGRMVHLGLLGWGAQPRFTDEHLNAIHGDSADSITAVGDHGTLLEFDGTTWAHGLVVPPINWQLRSVHGDWAVGTGGILKRQGTGWLVQDVLHSSGLNGVVSIPDDSNPLYSSIVVAVGDSGKVLVYSAGEWSSEIATPGIRLNAVWFDGSEIVAVGDDGTVVSRPLTGGDWLVAPRTVRRHLRAVVGDELGAIYAVGDSGSGIRFDPDAGVWVDEFKDGSVQLDARGLWTDGETVLGVGFSSVPLGPWMAFPRAENPTYYGFYDHGNMHWTFPEGGPSPTFNSGYMSSSDGFTAWVIIAAGGRKHIDLPRLVDIIGYDPVPIGQKSFNVSRALNPNFSMEGYRFNHLSMWRRTTWATTYGTFY